MNRNDHGGDIQKFFSDHYPNATTPWIDLSTGINPWPYPITEFPSSVWADLPTQRSEQHCVDAIARYLGVSQQTIGLASGSQVLISQLPFVFPTGTVSIVEPTYNEHRSAWLRAGHSVRTISSDDLLLDDAAVMVIVNPNNPDGLLWTLSEITKLASQRTEQGRWLVIDEAFADLDTTLSSSALAQNYNVIVVRSFGKFFGLAGVRLGAICASSDIVQALTDRLGPWAVSGPALAIAAKAYGDFQWHSDTRRNLARQASRLRAILQTVPGHRVSGTDLFLLLDSKQAPRLFDNLAKSGIYVRRFAYNPRWLRFGIPENDTVLSRIEAVFTQTFHRST